MKTMKCALFAVASVALLDASAVVYRAGLKQYYFQNGTDTWDMNKWDPSPMVMDLSSVPQENVDYTLGVFAGELSQNLGSSGVGSRTAENQVSGKEWGWNPMFSGFVYDGWMWMEAGTTYTVVRSDFVNGLIIYIDGQKVAQDWTRSSADVTPSITGWHPLRVLIYTHDWQAGHKLSDFAAVYWNTNNIPMPATDPVNTDWSNWHWLFDDGTEYSTPLRCAVDTSYMNATIVPVNGGYNVTVTGTVDLNNVVARLSATQGDPEVASDWEVSSTPISVTAGMPAVIFLPWNVDAVPYFTVSGEGEDTQFNPGYRAFTEYLEAQSSVTAGLCTWTGSGDGVTWNDRMNWDLQRVPMVDDSVLFTSPASVSLARAEQVEAITVANGAQLVITAADGTQTFTTGSYSVDGSLDIEAEVLFVADADGLCALDVAEDATLKFLGNVNAASSTLEIVKKGKGAVGFSYESAAISTTKPIFRVDAGSLYADATKAIGGTIYIGGGDETACVSNLASSAMASMKINILTNGFYDVIKGFSWDTMPTYTIDRGGFCRYAMKTKFGSVIFQGGEVMGMTGEPGQEQLQADGNLQIQCAANAVMSRMSLEYKMTGNEYPFKVTAARGTAPVDLLITGDILGGGTGATQTDYKAGDGIVVSKGANTFPDTGSKGTGFEVRAGTWVADGTPAFGNCMAWVLAGATLGGTGVVGGTISTANLDVAGTVRPGTIDCDESAETFGNHVYGTLTVGSSEVPNSAEFHDGSALEIGFGGGRSADALHVYGDVTLPESGSVLRLVNEAPEGLGIRSGRYVVLETEGTLSGEFETVELVGFTHALGVVYTGHTVEVDMPSRAFTVILR